MRGIQQCFATGNVNGDAYLGGFAGRLRETHVNNCYATGSVTGSTFSPVKGGLVGGATGGRIEKSYSTGSIHREDGADPTNKGFVGANVSSGPIYNDNFWDTQTSGQSSPGATGSATGKTTVEMQDIDTFTDTATVGLTEAWDMVLITAYVDEIWYIDDGVDYPRLGYEPSGASVTKTHTTDTILRLSSTASHSTDTYKIDTAEETSFKLLQEDGSALLQESGDFILLEQQAVKKEHATDTRVKTIGSKTHSTDTLLRKARTDTHTTDSSIEVGFVTIEKAHTTDSLLRASQNKTHTTNSLLRGQEQKAHTTNTLLRKSNNLTHTTDALKRNRIEIPLWVSPADEAIGIPTSHFLVFEMPESISDMHFHIQVDTAPTFDVSLQEFKSWQDQTNWQYFNGTDWVSMPAGGVSNSFSGNQARLAVNLDPNTYYRRARARIEVA